MLLCWEVLGFQRGDFKLHARTHARTHTRKSPKTFSVCTSSSSSTLTYTHFFFLLSFLMFESSPKSKTQITHRSAINTHNFLLLRCSSFLFLYSLLISFNFCLSAHFFYDFRLISISPLRFSLWIIEGWVGKFHFVVYIFTHNNSLTLSHARTHARTFLAADFRFNCRLFPPLFDFNIPRKVVPLHWLPLFDKTTP